MDYEEVPWERLKKKEGELYHSFDKDRYLIVFDNKVLPFLRKYLPDLTHIPAYKSELWIMPPPPSQPRPRSESTP